MNRPPPPTVDEAEDGVSVPEGSDEGIPKEEDWEMVIDVGGFRKHFFKKMWFLFV